VVESLTVACHWEDTDPTTVPTGADVYHLIERTETEQEHLQVELIDVEPWSTFRPDPVQGEFFFYVLSGHGILTWPMDDTEQPYLLDNDVHGWVPAAREFTVDNTGESSLRLLKVTVETAATYASRAGDIGKVTPSSPTHRKVYDDIYYFDLAPPERLMMGGYQVFTPGRKQGKHRHAEEVIYAVRGKAVMMSGGEEFAVRAGTAVYTPADVQHRLINDSADRFGYIVLECS